MHWMPEILYRFRRVCPETDVDLRMVDHELEPFELLEEGRTDVIFAARQSHINCDWTPLYYDAMYAILPEDYPTGSEETFPIEEFDGKEFLMPLRALRHRRERCAESQKGEAEYPPLPCGR